MKLTFIGADHEVTGSCHVLNACNKNILIDCGMEQGGDVYENQELPMAACDVDYVFLTHAHIDHSGLIPLLYVNGFRGKVFATTATVQLCEIMLKDSAHIQMFEAEWRNRKAKRSNGTLDKFIPLYDIDAAVDVMKQFVGCAYDTIIHIDEGIQIRFQDVGHLLGSASIEVWADEYGVSKKIVFSGDIGNANKPIVKNPQYVKEADFVVMESTYGNRSHGTTPDYVGELTKVFQRTFERGGNVVIPSFAVGRTQELLYFIRKIKEQHLIDTDFNVYIDSPLAIEATNIFQQNRECCFDDEALDLVRNGINPLVFEGLKYAVSSDESKLINSDKNPKVIISASGMCEAGRVRHHLKHNLWREECTILFAGYQANGTTGRAILDGVNEIRLFGEPISVKAEIAILPGASGHADKDGLLTWINSFTNKPEAVFVVHGEETACEEFTECLNQEYGYHAIAPYTGSSYDLIEAVCTMEGNREKKERRTVRGSRGREVFDRLQTAGKRLLSVIAHNEGGSNKDLAKFTDQIHALCDKWDK